MERLLSYGSVDAIPYYNCSWQSKTKWLATGIKRPWLGYPIIVLGVFILSLYPIILWIIFKKNLIRHACYKLIVFLAVVDMVATVLSCFISGTLFIIGAVFCAYPTALYIIGTVVLATWCTSCACNLSLFLNRLINITLPGYTESKIAYISIVFCILYFLFLVIFTPTTCFNSLYMAWLPTPLALEEPSDAADEYYHNTTQEWNNWIFVTLMILFFAVYLFKVKRIARGQKSRASTAIFIQCTIICFFNTVCALVYNSLIFISPSPAILLFCQVCWSVNHGCPAIIYITMNDTIRREFRRFLFGVKPRKIDDISTTNASRSRI